MKNLTKSIEDYLETILILSKESEKVHSVDIAKSLDVSKPAVHKAMTELTAAGFIEKAPYGGITLTEEGAKIAATVYDKHTTLKKFLMNIGVDEKTAEHDCCLIEHVISDITLVKIKEFNSNH